MNMSTNITTVFGKLESMPPEIRVLGIDLGTTNSIATQIIWRQNNQPIVECINIKQRTAEGTSVINAIVPSVVAIYNANVYVGEGAKRLRGSADDNVLIRNKEVFYDCKNDMGTNKTYHKAPEGFESPMEISSKIINFIYNGALSFNDNVIERTVVTVPASFQLSQRQDTITAAKKAGIGLQDGDLLDEPIAAFLDYIIDGSNGPDFVFDKNKKIMVFDFGGGTCDVAIFEIAPNFNKGPLDINNIAVSRYHRLGGGDIDKAIVHNILIPQIIEQNNLNDFDLEYSDKKRKIEPILLSIAEALKIELCNIVRQLKQHRKYDLESEVLLKYEIPKEYDIGFIGDKRLKLNKPHLSVNSFKEILTAFIDEDFLLPEETEYCWRCSIFAPVIDALKRGNLDKKQIDYCLLVGGSSLIPFVEEAMENFFSKTTILRYPNFEASLRTVSRGAAFHALAKVIKGIGLVRPVSYDSICIKTSTGLKELIPKGSHLPYPSYSVLINSDLVIPETSIVEPLNLCVNFVTGDNREVYKKYWNILAPVSKGDPIKLEYSISQNQEMTFKLFLNNDLRKVAFSDKIENPLTNVVNIELKKLKIEELEEDLKRNLRNYSQREKEEKFMQLANMCNDIGYKERAIDLLKGLSQLKMDKDAEILNKIAIAYGNLGNKEKEIKYYKRAAEMTKSWGGPQFNLVLAYEKYNDFVSAKNAIEKAISIEKSGPYFTLKARLHKTSNDEANYNNAMIEAKATFLSITDMNEWELSWYKQFAKLLKDDALLNEIKEEENRRNLQERKGTASNDLLPADSSAYKLVVR